jgi:hypothetical protein
MEGVIYCITNDNLYYIGSTTNDLQQRLREHINDSKKRNTSSKLLIKQGNYQIKEIEKSQLDNLKQREGEIIKEYKELYGERCVNRVVNVGGRTLEEHINYHKNYRNINKEILKKYAKQKIHCECGSIIQLCEKARHIKTKRHLDNLQK